MPIAPSTATQDTQDVVKISACRVCGNSSLKPVLSLGEHFVSTFVDREDRRALKAPLDLVLCDASEAGCGLVQLLHNVTVHAMYFNYWYKSGLNPMMRAALEDISQKASGMVQLEHADVVLDIGCNDGTLLRSYPAGDLQLIGFDPARNLMEDARVGTTRVFNDFFRADAFLEALGNRKAKIITSIAMFYDLQDPNGFVSDIRRCLDDNGVWVIQMSYLPLMLSENAFDNICHEHLEFYSLLSLENLLRRHGMKVVDMELNEVNGGSFRVYVAHETCRSLRMPAKAEWAVNMHRHLETMLKLDSTKVYEEFAARIETAKSALVDFIKQEVQAGKTVYAYGASTKGNTLLQYYGLDHRWIAAAAERNPDKWGKRTIGTWIPIVSEEEARKAKPDYLLILPWHFLENFKQREAAYLAAGGKFLIPLPTFQVLAGVAPGVGL